MSGDNILCTAALLRAFAGNNTTVRTIIYELGSPSDFFTMQVKELQERFPRAKEKIESIRSSNVIDIAEADLDWCRVHEVNIILEEDDQYPSRLRECPDAPLLLYTKGACTSFNQSRYAAIVGTRKCTDYGKIYCENIVEAMSQCKIKPVIVSGMAYGIDTCAHSAALRYGLQTIAVMGTGFASIYPARNTNLAKRIQERGALITEIPPMIEIHPRFFAMRNRIIAGMSDVTIVAESPAKGGSLITASVAFDYNRSVFAVPGKWDDKSFEGCNKLIKKDMASLAASPSDILEDLGWKTTPKIGELFDSEAETESTEACAVLKALHKAGEMSVDQIVEATGMNLSLITMAIAELEIEKKIIRLGTNRYVLHN